MKHKDIDYFNTTLILIIIYTIYEVLGRSLA